MPRASLGGGGIQYPAVQQYTDWVLDFGTAANGLASAFQAGALTNITTLTGPDGRPSPSTGTGGNTGTNVNAYADDGNGRGAISLAGGLTSGGSVNGGAFGWNGLCGCAPQLIKPTTASPTSLNAIEQQAWLYDFWLQFGPIGAALNRGDTGVIFNTGVAVPNTNPLHNANTGGASGNGGQISWGVELQVDGFLHFLSSTSAVAAAAFAINDTYGAPPTDICRLSFLIQAATLTSNATLSWYVNKVLQRTYTWTLGGGHLLPLWTDTGGANGAAFLPQIVANPPGQDAQAHSQSGLLCYGFRFRKGPAQQIFAAFASS